MTSQKNSVQLDGLRPDARYVVQVRARTVAGYGQYSRPAEFETTSERGMQPTAPVPAPLRLSVPPLNQSPPGLQAQVPSSSRSSFPSSWVLPQPGLSSWWLSWSSLSSASGTPRPGLLPRAGESFPGAAHMPQRPLVGPGSTRCQSVSSPHPRPHPIACLSPGRSPQGPSPLSPLHRDAVTAVTTTCGTRHQAMPGAPCPSCEPECPLNRGSCRACLRPHLHPAPSRKQRHGSDSEYTEKLQQYSEFVSSS